MRSRLSFSSVCVMRNALAASSVRSIQSRRAPVSGMPFWAFICAWPHEFLQDVYQRLLWEPNERKAKTLVASLGHAEDSPAFQELLKIWREYRQKMGWQVT